MTTVVALSRHSHPPGGAAAPGVDEQVEALASELAQTAVERDRAGGHPAAERELIRASGLLSLTIPRELGGLGADWSTFYRALRRLAEVDSALAHLFGFHHLQLAGATLYGSAEQRERLLTETAEKHLFWGNALNPLDKRARAVEADGGYRIDGIKNFASGSVGSDKLTFSAWHDATQTAMIGVMTTRQPGVTVHADWDAFGQRQTDSGSVSFDNVFVPHADVLQAPGIVATPQATLRSQVAQLIMANLYLGIARGAFDAARRYTRDEARPWFVSGVAKAIDDPFVQHRYGELWLLVRPAEVLADAAALRLDAAFAQGAALTAEERGHVAVAVAEAKTLAHRASIDVSTQLFELTGARSTSERYGLDRYWRNARVHTLHDPVDYKYRDLGRYALAGTLPDPTPYS
jgi:alkylation response protein AidB-like acyl-CoA dehydrogenase